MEKSLELKKKGIIRERFIQLVVVHFQMLDFFFLFHSLHLRQDLPFSSILCIFRKVFI
jgi:hypothetical protein